MYKYIFIYTYSHTYLQWQKYIYDPGSAVPPPPSPQWFLPTPPPPPPVVWCGGGLLPSPPCGVVWCGCGLLPPSLWCGAVRVWALVVPPCAAWGVWQTHAHDDIDDDDDDDDDNHDHHYHNHLSVSLVGRRVSSAHVPADDYRFIDRGGTIFVTVVALEQSE